MSAHGFDIDGCSKAFAKMRSSVSDDIRQPAMNLLSCDTGYFGREGTSHTRVEAVTAHSGEQERPAAMEEALATD